MATQLFFSWSGERSRRLAEAYKDLVMDSFPTVEDLDVFISSDDVKLGDFWAPNIFNVLNECVAGIVFYTPENITNPWLTFEAGAIAAKLDKAKCIPLLFDVDSNRLPRPLHVLQTSKVADGLKLLGSLNNHFPARDESARSARYSRLNKDFQFRWAKVQAVINELSTSHEKVDYRLGQNSCVLELQAGAVPRSAKELGNSFLSCVAANANLMYAARIRELAAESPKLRLPQALYPDCLIKLLESNANDSFALKALALVDNEEHFWQGLEGRKILRATGATTQRIFVFRNAEHLRRHHAVLLDHAAKYNVYALSYNELIESNRLFAYDFSVIQAATSGLLARYTETEGTKDIEFSVADRDLADHIDAFGEILTVAVPVASTFEIEGLVTAVFDKKAKTVEHLEKRHIEMSEYIEIHEYDRHEEEHAYYLDMMELMIEKIKSAIGNRPGPRILELGAGTGIFTKRLAMIPNVEVVAIEIDWACFKTLEDKMSSLIAAMRRVGSSVSCKYEDSRSYNPEGQFDVVCSSFSDHHIKKFDKDVYFANVKANLHPGAIYLVGDEFLPAYGDASAESKLSYDDALRTYHEHIIDIARGKGQEMLVKLEQAALDSGLERRGDFKLSCRDYEELLRRAGFNFASQKIGPLNIDDVGGVYVYEATVAAADANVFK